MVFIIQICKYLGGNYDKTGHEKQNGDSTAKG